LNGKKEAVVVVSVLHRQCDQYNALVICLILNLTGTFCVYWHCRFISRRRGTRSAGDELLYNDWL